MADFLNQERYPDPTAYAAFSAIEKQICEARAFRPIVYICSPFSGDVEENVEKARRYCRFAVDNGCIPIAPHLLFPQFLDDNDMIEREMGIHFGNVLMSHCAEVWGFGEYTSSGMSAEIDRAKMKGYKLRYFSSELK